MKISDQLSSRVPDERSALEVPSIRIFEGRTIQLISAFAIYLLLSIYFFGIPIILHPSRIFAGTSPDPTIFIWALVWWPYSFLHHINPFLPRVVYAPTGYNLAWTTSMPGPSLLAYPITHWFGPVVAYNVLCLLAPTSAAWAAFLLCRHLTGRFWAALLGGYVFGFSSYLISEMVSHLFLILIFPIPLMVLLVLLAVDQKISTLCLVLFLTFLLSFEFLTSTELFATTTLIGALAVALGLLFLPGTRRHALWRRLVPISCAYLVSLVLLTPYLYFVFMNGEPVIINFASQYSTDLLNFVLPTRVTLVGSTRFSNITDNFTPGPSFEATSYLGVPLLAVLALFTLSFWRKRSGKIILLMLFAVCVASLGPALRVGGESFSVVLPWALCLHLPLIDQALPARLSVYTFQIAGIMAAFYLSNQQRHWVFRTIMGLLIVGFLWPNVPLFRTQWISRVNTPACFRGEVYKRYLNRNDIVLILPFNVIGQMLWQAQTGMYFSISGGYLGPDPAEYTVWPLVRDLRMERVGIDFAEQLKAFLGAHRVKAIILDTRAREPWQRGLSVLNVTPVEVGDVLFYKVPSDVLVTYKDASPMTFGARYVWLLFLAGVSGAQRYVVAGLPLSELTPWEAERQRVLEVPTSPQPLPWDPRWQGDLWLGTFDNNHIGVGVKGSYTEVRPIFEKFGRYADQIYFPFPQKIAGNPETDTPGQLLMIFTPGQLDKAAKAADSILSSSKIPTSDLLSR